MSEEMSEHKIELVNKEIVGDYYIFDFEVPEVLQYEAGQYGIFMHVNKEIEGRKMRAFSIASAKHEEHLRIATKIISQPSDFKAKMRDLEIGELMSYTGPTGTFTLETDFDAVFIAGGIGITPIRSVLKQIEYDVPGIDVTLIYSEAVGVFPFYEVFDQMDIDIHYQTTAVDTTTIITKTATEFQNEAYYYIAGSPGFVGAITALLGKLGILKEHIKFDRFTGYDTFLKFK